MVQVPAKLNSPRQERRATSSWEAYERWLTESDNDSNSRHEYGGYSRPLLNSWEKYRIGSQVQWSTAHNLPQPLTTAGTLAVERGIDAAFRPTLDPPRLLPDASTRNKLIPALEPLARIRGSRPSNIHPTTALNQQVHSCQVAFHLVIAIHNVWSLLSQIMLHYSLRHPRNQCQAVRTF